MNAENAKQEAFSNLVDAISNMLNESYECKDCQIGILGCLLEQRLYDLADDDRERVIMLNNFIKKLRYRVINGRDGTS
jgi:hypothetical protein